MTYAPLQDDCHHINLFT